MPLAWSLSTDPLRGLIGTRDYVARHPSRWRLVVRAEAPRRRPPLALGRLQADLVSMLDVIPDLGILAVPGGSVLGPDGWVFTADGLFLSELTWFGGHPVLSALPQPVPEPRALEGTCLTIASDFACGNYGHLLLDCLGRFALALKVGLDAAAFDWIYCPRPTSPAAAAIMRALGVPLEKCVWVEDAPYIRADLVLATSFPGTRRNYPRWLAGFFRQACAGRPAGGRRLYVPRESGFRRRIANEAELLPVLAELGFETYRFQTETDEPGVFAAAACVVGAHGAGLSSIVFCPPGAGLLELMPTDHVQPYYYTLADAAGLSYGYLMGVSAGHRPPGSFGPSPFDFRVDPDEFRAALAVMLRRAGAG